MTFLDFFSGIGGFTKGMEQQGHECIGHCEVDKYAEMSYRSMHCITDIQRTYLNGMPLKDRQKEIMKEEYLNGEWFSNDIRSVRAGDIPRADCWCFGFPCQDISIAGKTVGFNGIRSSLFFTVTGLIKDIKEEDRPTTLFIENVKNLLSVNHGFDFAKLLVEMDEIGYDAEWSVENSKFYGVPQNRERVFIIGHFRGRGGREVFPIRKCNEQITELQGQQSGTVTTRTGGATSVGTYIASKRIPQEVNQVRQIIGGSQGNRVYDSEGLSVTLSSQGGGRGAKTGLYVVPVLTPDREHKRQNGRRFKRAGEPMFTLTAQDRHGILIRGGIAVKKATKKGYTEAYPNDSVNIGMPNSETRRGRVGRGIANTLTTQQDIGVVVEQPKIIDVYNKKERSDGLCGTLTASGNTSSTHCGTFGIINDCRIRKLTPKECFRLQGWADEYFYKAQQFNSDSQLYKQAGNGVTVNVISEIAKRL